MKVSIQKQYELMKLVLAILKRGSKAEVDRVESDLTLSIEEIVKFIETLD